MYPVACVLVAVYDAYELLTLDIYCLLELVDARYILFIGIS
jgi:hypothetical protein